MNDERAQWSARMLALLEPLKKRLTPDVLWDPLTDREKANLAAWLDNINHYECSHSNWQFFCILVNCALKNAVCPITPGAATDSAPAPVSSPEISMAKRRTLLQQKPQPLFLQEVTVC